MKPFAAPRGSCRSTKPTIAERAGFVSEHNRRVNANGNKLPPSVLALGNEIAPRDYGLRAARLRFRHQLVHRLDERFDGVHAIIKRGLLLGVELEFDDFFDATGAKDYRYAHVVTADSVFLIAIRRAGNQPLFV